MFKNKFLSFVVSAACALSCVGGLTACSPTRNSDEIKIVTTIFPQYDWAKNIVGDVENVSLTMLVDNGVDLHSYQPSVKDIATLSSCDLFIYVGGESDEWVEDALKNATNKNIKVINLLEVLGDDAKKEEVVEGMEDHDHDHEDEDHDHDHEDEDHDHDHEDEDEDHDHDHDHDHEEEYDEHVWLSLKNASLFCDEIATTLGQIDSSNAKSYTANANAYKKQLNALDEAYSTAVKNGTQKTLLFGDRFPFRYLVDDYNLKYYAAFVGCSAETEASFETIAFLAQKVDELSLSTILTLEGANHNIAQTIKESTKAKNQTILSMNSLQSVTAKDVAQGTTYLSVMQSNLEVLKQALK